MSYTKFFGTVPYESLHMGKILMPDLTKFFNIPAKYRNNPSYFISYTLRDGERLDQLAKRVYGDESRWYLITLMNDMYNLSEQLPLNESEMRQLLIRKYPFQESNEIHHFVDDNGYIVDPYAIARTSKMTVADAISANGIKGITIENYEYLLNDAKRNIKILDPDVVGEVENELARLYKDARNI